MIQENLSNDLVLEEEYRRLIDLYRNSVARYIILSEEMEKAEQELREVASTLGLDNELSEVIREIKRPIAPLNGDSDQAVGSDNGHLSSREREVLTLIGRGSTTRQIATQLNLASSTIETYRERLKTKLKLNSGTGLIRYAVIWVNSHNGKQVTGLFRPIIALKSPQKSV